MIFLDTLLRTLTLSVKDFIDKAGLVLVLSETSPMGMADVLEDFQLASHGAFLASEPLTFSFGFIKSSHFFDSPLSI